MRKSVEERKTPRARYFFFFSPPCVFAFDFMFYIKFPAATRVNYYYDNKRPRGTFVLSAKKKKKTRNNYTGRLFSFSFFFPFENRFCRARYSDIRGRFQITENGQPPRRRVLFHYPETFGDRVFCF